MIEIAHLSKSFGNKQILSDISYTFQEGKLYFIAGLSGSGKSVFTRCIVGLHTPNEGIISIDNEILHHHSLKQLYAIREKCLYIFQHAGLMDFLSVRENVALPYLKHFRKSEKISYEKADYWLNKLDLTTVKNLYPYQISLSVQKRVAVARALVLEPKYIILDEPTSGLDPKSMNLIDRLIDDIFPCPVTTLIIISHDTESILAHNATILFLHDKRIFWEGSTKQVHHSQFPHIKQFFTGSIEGPLQPISS